MAKWPYNTTEWKRVRLDKLRADPLCQYCPPGRARVATQVDHVKAVAAGGDPFAWANLRSSCQACHSRKTATMDGGFGHAKRTRMPVRGCDADGRPLDPGHWWNGRPK